MTTFDTFSLRPESLAALAAMAVTTPTPIQAAALPELLAGRDLIGQARTGSGKTLAFALPLAERLDERRRECQALVLVPTRELAAQVAGVLRALTEARRLNLVLLVGGAAAGPQQQAIRRGAQVAVGTPGRVLDHLRQGTLRLDALRLLVLDEADEMLDRGFAPDVERIIATTNPARQTALFSATVPAWVDGVAAKHLRRPVTVRVDAVAQPVAHVPHAVYDVPAGGKPAALRALLDDAKDGSTLVFGRTKHGVRRLAKQLAALGYPVAALQGNLSQNARDRVMAEFRSGATPILIATNVAARGLDVDHVARVINVELPETAALLTHRVGRTGRMNRTGEAITLLAPEDEPKWRTLLRELPRPPLRRPWRGHHQAAGDAPATATSVAAAGAPVSRATRTAQRSVEPSPTTRRSAGSNPGPRRRRRRPVQTAARPA